ncbi:twin-arginine translocase subunit TatC [Salidesulfovibrio onnuriiensis]|uniref:twin-arginine translocase subunit TatC n=1 Tax=Salidesulfovibrio onnuriiensis TaxID=2583823 RepID=UPI0011C90773|nr:twin-arginine translocase subunit TatC [Salidesulfovibrio onnuriiensis]
MSSDKDLRPDPEEREREELSEASSEQADNGTGGNPGPDSDVDDPSLDQSLPDESLPSESSATEEGAAASDADGDTDGEGEEEGAANMSLLDHLGELRTRLVRCFIAVAVGMVASYGFAEQMFDILMKPMKEVLKKHAASQMVLPDDFFVNLQQSLAQALQNTDFKYYDQLGIFVDTLKESLGPLAMSGHFQYTYPAEAFFAHIKISIVAGIFLMSPYLFAQLWGFIAPGLYEHERKWIVPMAVISAFFFTAGALFGYFVVFPFGFDFFASFASSDIAFTPKLNEYLSFCLKLLFAFGIVFELPLFIFFLARLGLVTSKGLRQKRKYAILLSFVTAAILTPPDPFTQCLMAGPLIILYELGVWVAFAFGKKKKEPEPDTEGEAGQEA